ncbi:MAG: hypothetical protein M3Q44_05345 [bacterium]|nr:hypothetical protein [bacterium]
MKRFRLHHIWLVLGAYGVWFAIFSGLEELLRGKVWKFALSLVLGIIVYLIIESKIDKK